MTEWILFTLRNILFFWEDGENKVKRAKNFALDGILDPAVDDHDAFLRVQLLLSRYAGEIKFPQLVLGLLLSERAGAIQYVQQCSISKKMLLELMLDGHPTFLHKLEVPKGFFINTKM